jgi:hypothetical protein
MGTPVPVAKREERAQMIVSPSAYLAARAAARERSTENLVDLEQAMRRLLYQLRLGQVGISALVAVRDELKDREVTVPGLTQRGEATEPHQSFRDLGPAA